MYNAFDSRIYISTCATVIAMYKYVTLVNTLFVPFRSMHLLLMVDIVMKPCLKIRDTKSELL